MSNKCQLHVKGRGELEPARSKETFSETGGVENSVTQTIRPFTEVKTDFSIDNDDLSQQTLYSKIKKSGQGREDIHVQILKAEMDRGSYLG